MAANTEIELKLFLSKADLKKLLASTVLKPLLRDGSKKTHHLVSSYYDTDTFAFKEQGIAYRVRDKGDGSFEATVKTSRKNSSGLSERLELNLPLTKDEAVLDGFEALGLEQSLRLLAPNGVVKLFTVDVERTTYLLDYAGAVAELAIDKGKIKARGKNTDAIDEIEIELKEGDKGALLQLAALITATVPVFVEKRSKYARGLKLLGLESELPLAKSKMRGPVRQELLKMVQQHGDEILELQNILNREQTLALEVAQKLRKQTGYLVSYISLAQSLTGEERYQEMLTTLAEWQKPLDAYLLVCQLEEEWEALLKVDSGLKKNNALNSFLHEKLQLLTAKVQSIAAQGKYTALIYGLIDLLYNSEWANDLFLQADSVATTYCQTLQQEQIELSQLKKRDFSQELAYLENMLCLGKSLRGKRFTHLNESWKKQGKALKELALWQEELLLLQGWLKNADQKLLVRDLGILYGSLL